MEVKREILNPSIVVFFLKKLTNLLQISCNLDLTLMADLSQYCWDRMRSSNINGDEAVDGSTEVKKDEASSDRVGA